MTNSVSPTRSQAQGKISHRGGIRPNISANFKGTVSFADVGQTKNQRLNNDMQGVVEQTDCFRSSHQHGRDPSQYGNMFNWDEFGEKDTTKMTW